MHHANDEACQNPIMPVGTLLPHHLNMSSTITLRYNKVYPKLLGGGLVVQSLDKHNSAVRLWDEDVCRCSLSIGRCDLSGSSRKIT